MLSPINLNPWIERDPFHKEDEFQTSNLIEPNVQFFSNDHNQNSPFSTSTQRPPFSSTPPGISNHVDFSSTSTSGISNNIDFVSTTTNKPRPTVSVSNNLDFQFSSTTRPKRKRTTAGSTRRPTLIIDNKVDFSNKTSKTTKRPLNNPFNKLGRDSNTTKRSTDDKIQFFNVTTIDTRPKRFRNEDNATQYLDNKAVTVKFENGTEKIQSRVNYNFYGDYIPITTRPYNFYPPYPPLTTTRRPVSYQNNRPNFYNRLESSTRTSAISDKLSGPFSFDSLSRPISAQYNYENMAVPLYVSPQSNYYKRPLNSYVTPTTHRPDLSTFFIVRRQKNLLYLTIT